MIRKAEFWGGLFWLAVGAFVAWQGHKLELGKLSDPGSGFALFWIGLLMIGLSLFVIYGSASGQGETVASLWRDTRYGRVLFVLALLLIFGFAFEPLGFIPCTLVLLLALMIFVDPVDPRIAVPVTFGATFGVWWVLTKLLKIQLPAGILAGILP